MEGNAGPGPEGINKGGCVEERKQPVHPDDVVDLGKYFAVLRKVWWKIVLLSLAVGVVTLIGMFQLPNMYQATAVITPATDERKQIPGLGALATFGIDLGGPSKVEDLETLFNSNDLTFRVFKKYNLWPIAMADRYDSTTGKLKATWMDRATGAASEPKEPTYWDAIRVARKALKISVNKKNGTLSVSFLAVSPGYSPRIVGYYLEEAKNRLQEEALNRSMKNKKFIEAQLGKTIDPLTRDRLYSLLGQEAEKEMLAHNREQFGFKVIDSPQVPDRKAKPNRIAVSLAVSLFSLPFWVFFYILLNRKAIIEG